MARPCVCRVVLCTHLSFVEGGQHGHEVLHHTTWPRVLNDGSRSMSGSRGHLDSSILGRQSPPLCRHLHVTLMLLLLLTLLLLSLLLLLLLLPLSVPLPDLSRAPCCLLILRWWSLSIATLPAGRFLQWLSGGLLGWLRRGCCRGRAMCFFLLLLLLLLLLLVHWRQWLLRLIGLGHIFLLLNGLLDAAVRIGGRLLGWHGGQHWWKGGRYRPGRDLAS